MTFEPHPTAVPCEICWGRMHSGQLPLHPTCENILLARLGEYQERCEMDKPIHGDPRIHLEHRCWVGRKLERELRGMAARLYEK